MHVKRQILHLMRDALTAAMPSASVYLDRIDPVPAARCPAVLVRESDRGEAIGDYLSMEGLQRRDLLVSVSLCVAVVDGWGDAADALGLQVEQLLAGETPPPLVDQLRALCLDVGLAGSRMFMSGEGEYAVAVLMHTWRCSYVVNRAAPDIAIT